MIGDEAEVGGGPPVLGAGRSHRQNGWTAGHGVAKLDVDDGLTLVVCDGQRLTRHFVSYNPAPGFHGHDLPGKPPAVGRERQIFPEELRQPLLERYGIENLLVCGVTTEVCVNTTVREANDRGYRCVVISDGCASYFPEFHEMGLKMIKAQGGIFGWVTDSAAVLEAMRISTT